MKTIPSSKKRQIKKRILVVLIIFSVCSFIIPPVRDSVLGLFFKRTVTIFVKNSINQEVVAGAEIHVGQTTFNADDVGKVSMRLPTGKHKIRITRAYYKDYVGSVYVSSVRAFGESAIMLDPLGELATVTVRNRINGNPLSGIELQTENGSYAKTNFNGAATVVLPKGSTEKNVIASGSTIKTTSAVIRPAQDATTNVVYAMPSLRLLTIANGGIQASDLDGSNARLIVRPTRIYGAIHINPATGSHAIVQMSLETDNHPKLYRVSVDGEVDIVADKPVSYSPVGWSDDSFLYIEKQNSTTLARLETQRLMKYDHMNGTNDVLYETLIEGSSVLDYVQEKIVNVTIKGKDAYIVTEWNGSYYYGSRFFDKRMKVLQVHSKADKPNVVMEWPAGYYSFIRTKSFSPSSVTLFVQQDGVKNSFWELRQGTVTELLNMDEQAFTVPTPLRWLIAPGEITALWESDKGIFLGDSQGKNSVLFARPGTYSLVSWLTNDYILLKQDGKLFVTSREGIRGTTPPVLILGAE